MLIMPALSGPDSARESLKATPLIVVVFVWVYHGRFINMHNVQTVLSLQANYYGNSFAIAQCEF